MRPASASVAFESRCDHLEVAVHNLAFQRQLVELARNECVAAIYDPMLNYGYAEERLFPVTEPA